MTTNTNIKLETALRLAEIGFHVFPLEHMTKDRPIITDFPNRATRDANQIRKWWGSVVYNIAISTSKFGDDKALLVVDVDNKGDKRGDEEIFRLECEDKRFPETYEQATPTGGRHIVYVVDEPVKQGVNVLAPGLDIRSKGGYIVATGSDLQNGSYDNNGVSPTPAPEWLVTACGKPREKSNEPAVDLEGINKYRAIKRAIEYLENDAPESIKGQGGDATAYKVIAHVKDFGVSESECLGLLLDHWYNGCGWSPDKLAVKIRNAYKYGAEQPGVAAPESQFEPVSPEDSDEGGPKHPFETLNNEYAFVLAGGGHHILWETSDAKGRFELQHLGEASFHKHLSSLRMQIGEKVMQVSKLWMDDKRRRSYRGICFMPGKDAPDGFYNLWKGFAVEPYGSDNDASESDKKALAMFEEHALKNVCANDEKLYNWLMSYFAHMVQRPWEKPLTALVFRGSKGTGKNALIERVGHLLGRHFMVADDSRYLTSNFNGHLESNLMICFDEAFWSGDKSAEGRLKGLITGSEHIIEHKGKEPYSVDNKTRVAIIGNEEWLVPASHDERRFAVFSVGDGRRQDRPFFIEMRERMETGGYKLLLAHLLAFDISKVDVNAAPNTEALADQKRASLDPLAQWWLDCLTEGQIVGSDFGGDWPDVVSSARLRSAHARYCRERNIRARLVSDNMFGRQVKRLIGAKSKKIREGNATPNGFVIPPLDESRLLWDAFVGHKGAWD